MKYQLVTNLILLLIFLVVPLIAEYLTVSKTIVPSTGFKVLLYYPFDFAYVFLVSSIILGCNCYFALLAHTSIILSILLSLLQVGGWFIVTFLLVGQLHIYLGGKL